jgi:hypothetical protein
MWMVSRFAEAHNALFYQDMGKEDIVEEIDWVVISSGGSH